VLNAFLGRFLGAAGLGNYFVFVSSLNVLGTIQSAGTPPYALKHVAAMEAGPGAARGILWSCLKRVLLASAALLPVVAIMVDLGAEWFWASEEQLMAVRYALVGGVGLAVVRLFAEALKARSAPELGFTAEFNVVPVVILLILVPPALLGRRGSTESVMLLHLVGLTVAGLLSARWLLRLLPIQQRSVPVPWRDLLSFWGVQVVNNLLAAAPYLILPRFATSADVGLFGVAHRLVALSATILVALAGAFGPQFASLHSRGDHEALSRVFKRSQIQSLLLYLPFFLAFTLATVPVLRLFGGEFIAARHLLVVMAFGRLVNAASGLGEYFLNMTGREATELMIASITLVLVVGGTLVVAPRYGVAGVAWVYSGAFAARAAVSMAVARHQRARIRAISGSDLQQRGSEVHPF
jgi:O-antigen/teichoic acid export membrane protein